MKRFKYLIIGGGAAGLGALDELVEAEYDNESLRLLEAREELGYTLGWMHSVPFSPIKTGGVKPAEETGGESEQERSHTGAEFRKKLLDSHEDSPYIRTKSRVFNIDFERSTVQLINSDGLYEELGFDTLICAPGGKQVLYGRRLLPGTRTSRIFSTYQVGEMMEHYSFLPGNRVIFLGESPYTIEAAQAAYERGIAEAVVVQGSLSPELSELVPDIPVREKSTLQAVKGDPVFEGIEIEEPSGKRTVHGDALVVDGDFVLEHEWRELLGVKWNLATSTSVFPDGKPLTYGTVKKTDGGQEIFLIGDAYNPDPNPLLQYRAARSSIKELVHV